MNKIAAKITKKIESENRHPRPRWLYFLKNVAVWFIVFLSITLAALSLSIIITLAVGVDWRLSDFLGLPKSLFLFLILPYPWIFFAFFIAAVSYYLLRHTNRGYRYATSTLIFAFVIFITVTAGGLSYARVGEFADQFLNERISVYNTWHSARHAHLWNRPERGLLTGEINSVSNDAVIIKSPDGRLWEVDKSKLPPSFFLKIGESLDLIGEPATTSARSRFYPRGIRHRSFVLHPQIEN